eukprot:s4531_g4.t1
MTHLMHLWREQLVQYPSSHIQSSFRTSKWPAELCRVPKDGSKDSAGDCTCVVEKAELSSPEAYCSLAPVKTRAMSLW